VESVEEATAIRANRKRAIRLCLLPGIIAGLVAAVIIAAVGLPLYLAAGVFVVVAAGLMILLWQRSPDAILRALGTAPMGEWEHPRLQNLVDGLCATMGLPRPTICVVTSPVPNAMALGRDPRTAVLIVTSGLDECLNLVELEGVLAHELSHIKRHDTVLAGVAVVITAPWASLVGTIKGVDRVHALVGRGREFAADQRAAAVVRYPPGIASALGVMAEGAGGSVPWPPGNSRTAALTRWLWIDPMAGAPAGESMEGNLDDTRVRAEAQSMR
jgi:Zn-dependent protease with chaperone function